MFIKGSYVGNISKSMLMFYIKNMRIKHKYLRNRQAKFKARKKAIKIEGGEFTQKWSNPWWGFGIESMWSVEKQKAYHKEHIDEWWVRGFLSGAKRGSFNAPKRYRKQIERPRRRSVKRAIRKMSLDIENVDDYDIPQFKYDANWDWF